MSTQNVYFTTPAVINQTQAICGNNASMDTAATLRGVQTYLCGGPSGAPYYGCPAVAATGISPTTLLGAPALTALNIVPVGTGSQSDGFGQNTKGICVMVGNAFSGQEIYYTTGAATYFGTGYSYDQCLMGVASVGKFINSFAFLNILDERLMVTGDTMYTLGDTSWTGSYQYYVNGTGGLMSNNAIATGVANFTAGGNVQGLDWTGTRAAGDLKEFTFANCASLNIHLGHSYMLAPSNVAKWMFTGGTQNGAEWTISNSNKDYYNAVQAGIAAGNVNAAFNNPGAIWDNAVTNGGVGVTKSYITGPVTDAMNSYNKVIRNGYCALGYRVGAMTGTTFGWKINLQRGTYGQLNYNMMGAMCNRAVKRAGYANLLDYVTQKILTPMEISTTRDITFQGATQPITASDRFYCGQLARRTKLMSSGASVAGFGLLDGGALYQAGLDWEADPATGKKWNTLYWTPEEYNDQYCRFSNTYWGEEYWSLVAGVITNAKTLSKLYRTYINRGVYTNSAGVPVKIISRRMWNFSQSVVVAEGAQFYQYSETPEYMYTFANWVMGQFLMFNNSNPYGDITFSSSDFLVNTVPNTNSSSPTLNTLGTWGGASGGHYCFDWSTGYYVFMWNSVTTVYNTTNKSLNAPAVLPFIGETR